jgi:hypothetical protein
VLLPVGGPADEHQLTEKLDVPGEIVHSSSR